MDTQSRVLSLPLLLLVVLSLVGNSHGQGFAGPIPFAGGPGSGFAPPNCLGCNSRRILSRHAANKVIEKSNKTEANPIIIISKAQADVEAWIRKAEEANTTKKLQIVAEGAETTAYKASEAMKELAQLSNNVLGPGVQTFNRGWDKFVQVLAGKTRAIMTGYATLFATYDKGMKQDKQHLDDLLNKMADPRTYQTYLNPFRLASAKLGTQAESALGFYQIKQRLTAKEPDSYWRNRLETEQEAKNRAQLAFSEGQRVIHLVSDGMEEQLNNVVCGMVDNLFIINKVRSKVRSHQEEEKEEARKAELQAIEKEAGELSEAIKDALWELSPAAPFKEAYNKISSGEEIGVWGWLTMTFEMGVEILSWVPTPAAPAARAFKLGRTAYKATKLVRKASQIVQKANKICGKIDTLIHMETMVDRLLAGLGRFTLVLKNIPEMREQPKAVGPSQQETKSLLELVKISEMVALPKRGKLSDEDLRGVLKSIQKNLGQGGFIVESMRSIVCKSLTPVLMASLVGGDGNIGCDIGPGTTETFRPSKPKPKPSKPKPKPAKTSPKPVKQKPKPPRKTLLSDTLHGSLLGGHSVLKREAQQLLAKDIKEFYSRPQGRELDLDLADRILEHAMAEISELYERDETDRPSFLDNDQFLEGFSTFFEATDTMDGSIDEPAHPGVPL